MAAKGKKKKRVFIKLINKETGYYYLSIKSSKLEGKLERMKYDPTTRKHAKFVEAKF